MAALAVILVIGCLLVALGPEVNQRR